MRICFVPQTQDAPGCYRCLFPAEQLRALGHDAAQPRYSGMAEDELLREAGLDRANTTLRLDPGDLGRIGAQVYVFHRQLESNVPDLMRWLRRDFDAAIVVDSDDDDLGIPSYNEAFRATHPYEGVSRGTRRRVARQGLQVRASHYSRSNFLDGVGEADAVTVTTPFLAERLSRFNSNVHVLPNYLRWGMWEDAPQQSELERPRLRIGWMGRAFWHKGDLAVLRGLIGPWLRRNPDVDFVAAGDEDVHDLLGVPEGQRVSYPPVHFRDLKLAEITATMDIGLVPLEENGFNDAKSALKGMEYAACGIPCIASPTESYRSWVEPGETGLLAGRPKDWLRALDELVRNDDARRAMGRAARAKASQHTIEQHIGKWESLYLGLGREPDLADVAIQRGALQKHGELKGLLELLAERRPLRTIAEIGTARGGTFHAFAQLAEPDACLISLDLPAGEFGGGYTADEVPKLRSFAQPDQELHFLLGDSHDPQTLEELRRRLAGRTLDFLFIDGDHTYEGVKADFEMYAPLCSGIVAFHDILVHPRVPDCQVDRFWAEVRGHYRSSELVIPGEWGGIGVLMLDEAKVAA